MTFDLITENEHLWAVRYDDCLDNVLDSILGQWNDVTWLRSFFRHNIDDLACWRNQGRLSFHIYRKAVPIMLICSILKQRICKREQL